MPSKWIQLGLLILVVFAILGFSTQGSSQWLRKPQYHKGVAFGLFEISNSLKSYRTELIEIRRLGANSVSLPIYWFQEDIHATEIAPYQKDGFDQFIYDEQIRSIINEAKKLELKVLLVPIVQLEKTDKGQWRGTLQPVNWDTWFNSYENFMLHYAHLAEETDVDLFCVGSELASTEKYQQEWVGLIQKIRKIYKGDLIYSANWDHYKQVTFWDELDYIGLSGYYSLSSELPVIYESLFNRWQVIQKELLSWQKVHDKPLLFTEIGYPSQYHAARSPWDYMAKGHPNMRIQHLCFRAFIETWNDTPELGGTYLWIWEVGKGGPTDSGYTWRGKPAQREIESWYNDI